MSVFVHAQGIKFVHAGGGVQKWQNSVHVVVECPLTVKLYWVSDVKMVFPVVVSTHLVILFYELASSSAMSIWFG